MATLPVVRPGGNLGASDNVYLTFAASTTETRAQSFPAGAWPSDLGSVSTLSWKSEHSVTATGDDIILLDIRVMNGSTVLAAADSAGGWVRVATLTAATTTDATVGPTAFAYVNTTADRAAWNGASVELQQTYTTSMANDSRSARVDTVELTGTYAATPSAPQSLTATAGDASASLSWTAPASTGDSAITDYVVEYRPGYVTDSFNRADSTSLGTADTGEVWQSTGGTWGITANRAYESTATSSSVATVETGTVDQDVQATMPAMPATGYWWAIVARFADSSNFYRLEVEAGGDINLYKTVGGTNTKLVDVLTTAVAGDVYRLTVSGSTVTAYRNGSAILTATDTDLTTGTRAGLRLGVFSPDGTNPARWDDFSATKWAVFNDGVSTATTATVTGLTNGTAYDFRVRAKNTQGTGPASNIASATPAAATGGTTVKAVTADAAFGALTSIGSVTRDRTVTATAAFGGLTAAAAVTKDRAVTASAALGALTTSATVTRDRTVTGTAHFGGMTSTATVGRVKTVAGAAAFGGLASTAAVTRVRTVAASATFGSLTSSAAVTKDRAVTAVATFGGLTSAATVTRVRPVTATAAFGSLTTVAAVTVTAPTTDKAVTATADFGALTTAAQVTVQRVVTATAQFGALTSTAAVTVDQHVTATAGFGGLTSTAAVTRIRVVAGTAAFGALTSTVTVTRVRVVTATAAFGGLIAAAVVERSRPVTGVAHFGPLTTTAAVTVVVAAPEPLDVIVVAGAPRLGVYAITAAPTVAPPAAPLEPVTSAPIGTAPTVRVLSVATAPTRTGPYGEPVTSNPPTAHAPAAPTPAGATAATAPPPISVRSAPRVDIHTTGDPTVNPPAGGPAPKAPPVGIAAPPSTYANDGAVTVETFAGETTTRELVTAGEPTTN